VSDSVPELAAAAVRERSRELLLAAFVAAARRVAAEEARGDVRDGLIEMSLPFRSAVLLGLDADALVAEARPGLDRREAELLDDFAARDDRDDIEAFLYLEAGTGTTFHYRWRGW
jgi:hypothetical protein